MKKISVIIPMYNGERYIRQCIGSVTAQTCPDLEIIVTDDGSTDGGPEICGELASEDRRIRLYRQENGGVSSARNRGIDEAEGDYLFFLDCDDMIHPRLLEELVRRMEEQGAGLGFCGYARTDSGRAEEAFGEACAPDAEVRWETADEKEIHEWFHVKYTDVFSGIGGKLIRRALVGDLRFDESLTNGEDTWFLYRLTERAQGGVFCREEWYYYRTHGESATNSAGTMRRRQYFECSRRIRDAEYGKGRTDYALRWEIILTDQLKRSRAALEKAGEKAGRGELKRTAARERKHPMFRRICLSDRVLFRCCFAHYPLYTVLNGIALTLTKGREG